MVYNVKINRLKRSSKGGLALMLAVLLLIAVRIFLVHDNIVQLIYSVIYLFFGIILLMDGLGSTFGRAFININNVFLSVRSGLISRKQTIYWKDIRTVEIYNKRLLFRFKNNKNTSVVTSRIPDEHLEKINEIITEEADLNGFEIKDMRSK